MGGSVDIDVCEHENHRLLEVQPDPLHLLFHARSAEQARRRHLRGPRRPGGARLLVLQDLLNEQRVARWVHRLQREAQRLDHSIAEAVLLAVADELPDAQQAVSHCLPRHARLVEPLVHLRAASGNATLLPLVAVAVGGGLVVLRSCVVVVRVGGADGLPHAQADAQEVQLVAPQVEVVGAVEGTLAAAAVLGGPRGMLVEGGVRHVHPQPSLVQAHPRPLNGDRARVVLCAQQRPQVRRP
mmetsp:Transcript_2546/g.9192  ORF Transcript_2546/g.9192 Transcript_2546/m.9192 type:complete len:241 (+) Transcript_2546:1954-2676(+)